MLSLQTMEFWPYFYTHWNYGLISPNILILALFLETLEFWPHPSKHSNSGPIFFLKHWNSGPILIHVGFLILSFKILGF